jgi:hypothetical protein
MFLYYPTENATSPFQRPTGYCFANSYRVADVMENEVNIVLSLVVDPSFFEVKSALEKLK